MLLSALNATNSRGESLNLPLEDISGGIIVRGIDGLDPVKATLVSASFANQDGEQFHSSRRDARNIVLHLGLDPDYAFGSVKEIRDQLYKFFMPKLSVLLGFNMFDRFSEDILTQNKLLNIQGYIESFDAPLFTNDPVADISIMCYDPDFIDPVPVTLPMLSQSDIHALAMTDFNYEGTVETGTLLTITPNAPVPQFTLYYSEPDGIVKSIDFVYPLLAGDVLRISSVPGAKSALLTRGGVETSVLYALTPQSGWLELWPGVNMHALYTAGVVIPYTLTYSTRYGGL